MMMSFFWNVLLAVSVLRVGALLRSRGVPTDVDSASLLRASKTEVAQFAQMVFDDIREDWAWEASPEASVEGDSSVEMDGFARAEYANACTSEYHAPGMDPLVLPKTDLKVKYILHGKSGSSEIRSAIDSNGERALHKAQPENQQNYTLFTIIRDPLSRSVSSFWEKLYDCVGYKLDNDIKDVSASMSQEAVSYYEKMITMWETKTHPCMGPHGIGQRSRMPDSKERPVKFVGTLAELERDWQALGHYQMENFGVESWPHLPAKPVRASEDFKRNLVNTSVIPASLAQRVCTLFRDDYCCFKLPIPSVCDLKC